MGWAHSIRTMCMVKVHLNKASWFFNQVCERLLDDCYRGQISLKITILKPSYEHALATATNWISCVNMLELK